MFVVFGGIDIYNIVFLCQSKNIMFVFWDVIKKLIGKRTGNAYHLGQFVFKTRQQKNGKT